MGPGIRLCAVALLSAVMASCGGHGPEPQASSTSEASASSTASPTQPPSSAAPALPSPVATPPKSTISLASASALPPLAQHHALDFAALKERKDPDRVLRFYASALDAGDWNAAAQAWGKGSGVTARSLKSAYDRPERPILTIGKGAVEGAAGSLYYEAPVVLRFGASGEPRKGAITLRRVNDVPGATADQLRWHIYKSTLPGDPSSH
jgi:hypothetical protein